MNYISKNIDYIKSEIINSCKKVNRENEANLIAVTKTVDIDVINEAIESGITDVGENKPQELARKYDVIGDKVRWHQIGSLQTNKVKYIIDKVYMIHSIDRLSLCEEIQKRAEKINKEVLKEALQPKFGKSLSRSAVAQRLVASPKSAALRKTSRNNPINNAKRISQRNKTKGE